MSHRSVLITGASRGIGRATAGAFAAAGWTVVAGVRDPAALEPFGDPAITPVHLDVTDPGLVGAAVARAGEIGGGALTCVVGNAGWAPFGAVEDVDLRIARAAFETNFFGAMAVLQAALPAMRRAGRGVVVHVSTLSGRIPLPLFGMYSATKAALAAASDALALELGPAGIRSVVVEAGVVRTEFARSTVTSGGAGGDDPVYGPIRDRVLGTLRGAREAGGLEAADVAGAVLRAAEDPATPPRVILADPALGVLTGAGMTAVPTHADVIRLLGLDAATPGA